MMFISHILSGIFLLKLSSIIFPIIPFNILTILFVVFLQLLPDFDILWSKNLSSHHESYFHAPIFWLGLGIALYVVLYIVGIDNSISQWIAYLVIIQTLSHLLFDYITARTAGIILFYPFNKKEYSLCVLNKKHGEFSSSSIKAQFKFLKHYVKNKLLLYFEIIMCLLGIVLLVI